MVTVELTPYTYTPLRKIFWFSINRLLSTVTITPSDWDHVNRSVSFKQFRLESRRRAAVYSSSELRNSWLAGVSMHVSYQGCVRGVRGPERSPRVRLGSMICQEFEKMHQKTAWKLRRIETSLVIVIFILRVLTYVVAYTFFWNWIGVVRSVSHAVWLDKRFVIWHCLRCYFEQIVTVS